MGRSDHQVEELKVKMRHPIHVVEKNGDYDFTNEDKFMNLEGLGGAKNVAIKFRVKYAAFIRWDPGGCGTRERVWKEAAVTHLF